MRLSFFLLGIFHATAASAQVVTQKDLADQARHFTRTVQMIPMRDGVKLHTLIYTPKEGKAALPFVMMRTPYGIESRGPKALKEYLKDMVDEGYIFVFQDIRGRHKSEGQFVMLRAPRDPKNATAIDEGSDTNDTIDWLLKNVPGHNGRVGMLGVSYPGWLTVEIGKPGEVCFDRRLLWHPREQTAPRGRTPCPASRHAFPSSCPRPSWPLRA